MACRHSRHSRHCGFLKWSANRILLHHLYSYCLLAATRVCIWTRQAVQSNRTSPEVAGWHPAWARNRFSHQEVLNLMAATGRADGMANALRRRRCLDVSWSGTAKTRLGLPSSLRPVNGALSSAGLRAANSTFPDSRPVQFSRFAATDSSYGEAAAPVGRLNTDQCPRAGLGPICGRRRAWTRAPAAGWRPHSRAKRSHASSRKAPGPQWAQGGNDWIYPDDN